MNEAVYARLADAARARQFVFYGELAPELNLDMENPQDRLEIGQVLGEISRFEVANGRPMLSSIVVEADDHLPDKRFFALGQELGQVADHEDEVSFAVRQIKMTHEYWSELEPFGGGEELV